MITTFAQICVDQAGGSILVALDCGTGGTVRCPLAYGPLKSPEVTGDVKVTFHHPVPLRAVPSPSLLPLDTRRPQFACLSCVRPQRT
jgi:hypothetical protein